MLYNKFFYNADENNGGGVAEEVIQPEVIQEQKVEKVELSLEQMKAWGFDSQEQLEAHFTKLKEQNISEEEKQKQEALDNAELRRYAIANDLLKEDDFKTYETLSQKQAIDLVQEKHFEEFKEDNPEIEDEDTLKELAKQDFENTYKLNSESEKVRNRALAKIEKEAKELKSPVESKFVNAKEQYETAKNIAKTYPEFEKFVSDKVKQHTPDKAIVYKVKDGDTEIPVEIELTEEDRKAMAKEFAKHTTFHKFSKSADKKELEAELDRKMQGWVKVNKAEQIYAKAVETGIGIGKAKGSTVGANNPFPLIDKGSNVSANGNKTNDEILRESHNKAARIS